MSRDLATQCRRHMCVLIVKMPTTCVERRYLVQVDLYLDCTAASSMSIATLRHHCCLWYFWWPIIYCRDERPIWFHFQPTEIVIGRPRAVCHGHRSHKFLLWYRHAAIRLEPGYPFAPICIVVVRVQNSIEIQWENNDSQGKCQRLMRFSLDPRAHASVKNDEKQCKNNNDALMHCPRDIFIRETFRISFFVVVVLAMKMPYARKPKNKSEMQQAIIAMWSINFNFAFQRINRRLLRMKRRIKSMENSQRISHGHLHNLNNSKV